MADYPVTVFELNNAEMQIIQAERELSRENYHRELSDLQRRIIPEGISLKDYVKQKVALERKWRLK